MNSYKVIGVMSGTSMDGLDLAHCVLTEKDGGVWDYEITATQTIAYGDKWRLRLSKLRHQSSLIFHKTDRFYGHFIAESINDFIADNNLTPDLIASHGHTVFHQPENNITVQIGDGNAISALTGIPVVTNFRAMDVVLGGEGAPLAPLGDHLLFNEYDLCVNLGGFANISAELDGARKGYDICPANIVLNRIAREFDKEFDEDGAIAEQGSIDYDLLGELNNIRYYAEEPPKTLGREWISQEFWGHVRNSQISKEDKMKTLVDHIAYQISEEIIHLVGDDVASKRVLVTGGGVKNLTLIDHLKSHTEAEVVIPDTTVVDYKEALIFALLGVLRVKNQPNVLSQVTGASKDSIGGSLYGDFSKLIG